MTMQHFKGEVMKKIFIIFLIAICFSGVVGCKEKELLNENIKLRAQVVVLEQQLEICGKDLRSLSIPPDDNKYDPSVTNPNDDMGF